MISPHNLPRIIALYSPAPRSGKGTISNYLCSQHGYAEINFADPIKMVVSGVLGPGTASPSPPWARGRRPDRGVGAGQRHRRDRLGTCEVPFASVRRTAGDVG